MMERVSLCAYQKALWLTERLERAPTGRAGSFKRMQRAYDVHPGQADHGLPASPPEDSELSDTSWLRGPHQELPEAPRSSLWPPLGPSLPFQRPAMSLPGLWVQDTIKPVHSQVLPSCTTRPPAGAGWGGGGRGRQALPKSVPTRAKYSRRVNSGELMLLSFP